jgi:gamma-glutamyl-gamma-aminobutyrate hydrolase PuuD
MKKTTEKRIIGIYADTFNGKVGQTFAYMQFLSQFGNVRMISTCDNLDNIVNEVDALVVPGGADVDATLYGSVPGVMDGRTNQHYEYLDKVLIPQFINAKKPLIGICRGMQTINVMMGGTLTQHITGHQQGDNRVATNQKIYLYNESKNLYGGLDVNTLKEIEVNSMHHQCVDNVANGFNVVGYSELYEGSYVIEPHIFNREIKPKDGKSKIISVYGVPEVMIHESLPIILFQYHPEEFNCSYAKSLINNILQ